MSRSVTTAYANNRDVIHAINVDGDIVMSLCGSLCQCNKMKTCDRNNLKLGTVVSLAVC